MFTPEQEVYLSAFEEFRTIISEVLVIEPDKVPRTLDARLKDFDELIDDLDVADLLMDAEEHFDVNSLHEGYHAAEAELESIEVSDLTLGDIFSFLVKVSVFDNNKLA